MTLDAVVASLPQHHAKWDECVGSLGEPVRIIDGSNGLLVAYQEGYETSTADVIAYIHDDVLVHDAGWRERVLKEFEDPTVGVVGFGGALGHGEDDIYKVPYKLTQLRRIGYLSNTDDAELHGDRFKGECDVATVDGFAVVLRHTLLNLMGGWTRYGIGPMHLYDYLGTLAAHRYGFLCRAVGISCLHYGGMTATTAAYQKWADERGGDAKFHADGHRILYEEFRDCLPIRVGGE